MKKLLFFMVIFFITGCEKTNDDVINDIRTHFVELESYQNEYKIETNLSENAQDFVVSFFYNQNSDDILRVIEPESIKDLEVSIAKGETPEVIFDEMIFETFIEENLGVSPSDILSFAIFDLKEKQPSYFSATDVYKLTFNDEKISKDIYLNPENYDIIAVEVYVEDKMISSAKINGEVNFG